MAAGRRFSPFSYLRPAAFSRRTLIVGPITTPHPMKGPQFMRPQRTSPRRTSKRRLMTAGLLSGGAAGLLLLAPSLADAASPLADAFGQTDAADHRADRRQRRRGAGRRHAPTRRPEPPTSPSRATGCATCSSRSSTTARSPPSSSTRWSIRAVGCSRRVRRWAAADLRGRARPAGWSRHAVSRRDGRPRRPGLPGRRDRDPRRRSRDRGRDRRRHRRWPVRRLRPDLVANTIGISAPTCSTSSSDGSTVAEIATAAGADPQAVIDALVADTQERLAAAVQSGRITQAEADERIEDATERITNFVNGERPSTDEADRRRDAGEHRDGVHRDDRDHDRLSRGGWQTSSPHAAMGTGETRSSPLRRRARGATPGVSAASVSAGVAPA